VEIGHGGKIRVRPENLQALDCLHPLLITPTALHDPEEEEFFNQSKNDLRRHTHTLCNPIDD
jgi:hypothetical protein